jgi:hypothetical protein
MISSEEAEAGRRYFGKAPQQLKPFCDAAMNRSAKALRHPKADSPSRRPLDFIVPRLRRMVRVANHPHFAQDDSSEEKAETAPVFREGTSAAKAAPRRRRKSQRWKRCATQKQIPLRGVRWICIVLRLHGLSCGTAEAVPFPIVMTSNGVAVPVSKNRETLPGRLRAPPAFKVAHKDQTPVTRHVIWATRL